MTTQKKKMRIKLLLFIFVIPIAIGVLLGYEMSGNCIDHIPTVIVDHDNTEFSRKLIQYIATDGTFDVVKYSNQDADIEEMIYSNQAHVGVVIPADLYADMLGGSSPKVLLTYDGSVMNVMSAAKSAMSEILLTVKAGYMQSIFAGKLDAVSDLSESEIQPIKSTYKTLYNPTKNYRDFLIPGILINILQMGIALCGLEKAREKKTDFNQDISNILYIGFIGIVPIALCLGIQVYFFGMPARGSIWAFFVLTFLFSLCQTVFGYMMGKFIDDKVLASQATCILLTPSTILGGYTFPLMAMPKAFQILSYIIPYTKYADAVRAISLKDVSFIVFLPQMRYLLIFLFVELLIMLVLTRLFSTLNGLRAVKAEPNLSNGLHVSGKLLQAKPSSTADESEMTAI